MSATRHLRGAGLLWVLLAAAALLGGLMAVGLAFARPAAAQDLGLDITKTLSGGSRVKVGQILEFSIRITNTGTLTVTELDLIDTFDPAIVAPVGLGPFARAGDPPLSDTEPYSFDGDRTISWALLAGPAELAPGEALTVLVRLRAVRPTADLQVVNRARVERAVRSDGGSAGGGSAEAPARPEGARLPLTKSLGVPAPIRAGLPITFTIVVTNDGAVDITRLPLRDIYNPAALRFVAASPPPSAVDEVGGRLEWGDLLEITGRGVLPPGEAIVVTTRFIAVQNIEAAVNVAEVSGARDEYDNAIGANRAEVPIFIVPEEPTAPAETSTPAVTTTSETATPDDGEQPEAPGDEETDEPRERDRPSATPAAPTDRPSLVGIGGGAAATATPAPTAPADTATPAAAVTAAPASAPAPAPVAGPARPSALPSSGGAGGLPGALPLVAIGLLALGVALAARRP